MAAIPGSSSSLDDIAEALLMYKEEGLAVPDFVALDKALLLLLWWRW